jgi:hypothetical protein
MTIPTMFIPVQAEMLELLGDKLQSQSNGLADVERLAMIAGG